MQTDPTPMADPGAAGHLSPLNVTDASIGIVVSDWHSDVTAELLAGTVRRLTECGVETEDIYISHVPGAVELAFGARQMAVIEEPSAVIMLGCVKNDGTPNFQSVCGVVTQAVTHLNLRNDIPFIHGVLMVDDREQLARLSGGDLQSLGATYAESALKMVNMMANIVMR